jgi:hypothetical protein
MAILLIPTPPLHQVSSCPPNPSMPQSTPTPSSQYPLSPIPIQGTEEGGIEVFEEQRRTLPVVEPAYWTLKNTGRELKKKSYPLMMRVRRVARLGMLM